MGDSPDFLPKGWVVETRPNQDGTYKCYIAPSSGLKFQSKKKVYEYLKIEDPRNTSRSSKRGADVSSTSQRVGKTVESPDFLPEGWIVETRPKKNGTSYKRYIAPSSRQMFDSKKKVFEFLNIEDPSKSSRSSKRGADVSLASQATTSWEDTRKELPAGWNSGLKVRKSDKGRKDSVVDSHTSRSRGPRLCLQRQVSADGTSGFRATTSDAGLSTSQGSVGEPSLHGQSLDSSESGDTESDEHLTPEQVIFIDEEEVVGKPPHVTPTNIVSKQLKNNQEKPVTLAASSSNQEVAHYGVDESNPPTLVGKATIFIPDPRTALLHCDNFVPVYGFPVAPDQVTRYKKVVEDHGHIASVDLFSEINTLVQTTQIVLGVVEGMDRLGDSLPSRDNLEAWGLCLGNARIMHFNVGWLDNILQTLESRLNFRKKLLPAEIQGLKEEISRLQQTIARDEAKRGRLLLEIADVAGRIGTAQYVIAVVRKSVEDKEKELATLS